MHQMATSPKETAQPPTWILLSISDRMKEDNISRYHDRQPDPETLRCRSSTVVKAPMRLTRYEQKMIYGTNEITGLLPMGYLSFKSELMASMERFLQPAMRLQR